jgi:hypothetical protein
MMRQVHPLRGWTRADPEEEQAEADRQTSSLAGLALALAIVVVGLFLIRELHAKAVIEDCLMSGQRNCDVYVANLM